MLVLLELWLVSLLVPSLAMLLHLSVSDQLTAVQRIPLGRLPEFLMGVVVARLVALAPATDGATPASRPAIWSGIALLIGATTLIGLDEVPFPYTMGGVAGPAAAAVILIVAQANDQLVGFLGWRPFVILGEASYALYLLHDPVWSWLDRRLHLVPAGSIGCVLFIGGYLVGIVVLSLLVMRLIEQPARRAIRRRLARQ
jgi:peptidoglycan/LPS O-acetylase OafA/YrhL